MATFNYDAVKNLLRCPKTRAELAYTGDALVNCDPETRLRYPVIDGFPVLLIDEATALPESEWAAVMKNAGRDPLTGQPAGPAPAKG